MPKQQHDVTLTLEQTKAFITNLEAGVKDQTLTVEKKKEQILENITNFHQLGLKHFQMASELVGSKDKDPQLQQKYKDHYAAAALYFAAAVKPVLSKPIMMQLLISDCSLEVKKKLLDSLEHLGHIYLQDKECFTNHAKAAAIYQYCAAFTQKLGITELNGQSIKPQDYTGKAFKVEQEFLQHIRVSVANVLILEEHDKSTQYKQELVEIRAAIRESLKVIEQHTMDEIAVRAREIEDIYKACTDFFIGKSQNNKQQSQVDANNENYNYNGTTGKNINIVDYSNYGLLQKLLQDCFKQLDKPPCDYAIVGFGSLGGGRMTPWSDLEFAILIDDKHLLEQQNSHREYFRNLTKLLHIKVINLGETPLRTAAVDVLNDFKTGEEIDDWFWDEFINKGFTFDALNWSACKIPLGRQGIYTVKQKIKQDDSTESEVLTTKRQFELICTPQELSEFQSHVAEDYNCKEEIVQNNASKKTDFGKTWYDTDTHLVQALRIGGTLIDGSQSLLNQYRQKLVYIDDDKSAVVIQNRIVQTLQKDLNKFQLKLGNEEEGKLYDVKQDIFRIADRVVDALALYFNATANKGEIGLSIWQMIDDMTAEKHLNIEGAQHLKEAISIATELRLRTYLNNKGQKDSFSTYQLAINHLDKHEKKKLIEETFYLKDTSILHYFYYITIALQSKIDKFYKQDNPVLISDPLFDNSKYTKCMVYARFLNYFEALKLVDSASQEQINNDDKLNNLLSLCIKTEKSQEAIKIGNLIYNKKDVNNIAKYGIICNVGYAYYSDNNFNKAIELFKLALNKLNHSTLDKNSEQYQIGLAKINNALGNGFYATTKYEEAISYYQTAYDIFIKNNNYEHAASCYNNLGTIYRNIGDYYQAINCYKLTLENYKRAYKDNPNHSNIATVHNNLGSVYEKQEKYKEAEEEHDISLKIFKVCYSEDSNNPHIAKCYNYLGSLSNKTENFVKAKIFFHYAEAIFSNIYNENSKFISPDIVTTYEGLVTACKELKEYKEVIKFYKKILQLQFVIHQADPNHTDIIATRDNISNATKQFQNETLQYMHNENPEININNNNLQKMAQIDVNINIGGDITEMKDIYQVI